MLSSRVSALSLYLPRVLYDSSRNVRGGVTIPIKKVRPLIQRKIKDTFCGEEKKKILRDNAGIAYGLMRNIESNYDVDDNANPEEFFDINMDASDAHYIMKEHTELAETDIRTKYFHNVKRRHFKEEKLPNMVTYIEKHQIKHLHKQDPEFWNVDKLAECFPASPAVIKKILNSQFTAFTVETVQKHDKTVRKNWDLFQKGKLSFDEELEEHYAKFVGRLKFETNVNEIKKFLPPPPDFSNQSIKEFSEIITSSKKYKKLREEERKHVEVDERGNIIYTSNDIRVESIEEDDLKTKSGTGHFTLEELRKKIDPHRNKSETEVILLKQAPKKALSSSPEVEGESGNIYKEFDLPNQKTEFVETETSLHVNKRLPRKLSHSPPEIEESKDIYKEFDYLNHETGVVDKKLPFNFSDAEEHHILLRIRIPKRLWQKDKLYRIKDCFYDDQGMFLYRVPGLF